MIGRRVLVGVGFSLLRALAFIALAAASASAATSGTTAVTCVTTANNGPYTDAHCDTTSANGTGGFKHVPLVAQTTSEVQSTNEATKGATTNEATPALFQATIAGVTTELFALSVSSEGTLENKLEGEVHKIIGGNIVVTYAGVLVLKPSNCSVHSPGQLAGTVKTNTLKSESVEGTPMTQKFEPAMGTELAKLEFEGAKCMLHEVAAKVEGTVSAEPSGQMTNGNGLNSAGATLKIDATKGSTQLEASGHEAFLASLETIKMKEGNPIATTGPPFP